MMCDTWGKGVFAAMAFLLLLMATGAQFGCEWIQQLLPEPATAPGTAPTIRELYEVSDLVVEAKVVRTRSRWIGKKIYTIAKIRILHRWKGDEGETGDREKVAFLGGTVDKINLHVSHEAKLSKKEVAILFLVQPADTNGPLPHALRICSEWGKVNLPRNGEPLSRLNNSLRVDQIIEQLQELSGPDSVRPPRIGRIIEP